MWNDYQYLLFWHIADLLYQDHLLYALQRLPNLTFDHTLLTGFSRMEVHIFNFLVNRNEKKTFVALCKEYKVVLIKTVVRLCVIFCPLNQDDFSSS